MRTLRVKVYVATNREGSRVSATINVEVEDDASQEEIERIVAGEAADWIDNNIDSGWFIVEEA